MENLKKGVKPDFVAFTFSTLPTLFSKTASADSDFIRKQKSLDALNYRQVFISKKSMPSQTKTVYGYIYDKLDRKFLEKRSTRALSVQRPDWEVIPFDFQDDLDVFANVWGVKVCIQKVQDHMARAGRDHDRFEVDQQKLDNFCTAHDIVLLDPVEKLLAVQDRFQFNQLMKEFLKTLPKNLRELFGVPTYVVFSNKEADADAYELQSKKEGHTPYPVIIKVKEGARTQYSHYFYVVKNRAGWLEAMNFEGFKNQELLCQQYFTHFEQVYKIYGIGDWFEQEIRESIPHEHMTSKDAVSFDSQVKFARDTFKTYSPTISRVKQDEMLQFFAAFTKAFEVNLYGVDILVDEETDKHYIIDCNYFSSYTGIKVEALTEKFDELIATTLTKRHQAMLAVEEPVGQPSVPVEQKSVASKENSGFKSLYIALGVSIVLGGAAILLKKKFE